MSRFEKLDLGPLTITSWRSPVDIEGQTTSRQESLGKANLYKVRSVSGAEITLARVSWRTDEEDIRPYGEVQGPVALRRLEGGALRMTITTYRHDLCWMELSQARVDPASPVAWSNAVKASWTEVDEGANLDARETLLDLGAETAGKRSAVLGDTSNRREYLAVVFPEDNRAIPLASYAITRILPLLNEYKGPQEELL